MQVVKRSGAKEDVDVSKITKRVADLVTAPTHLEHVDPSAVAVRVVAGLHNGVTTAALDELAVETAAHFATSHYNYSTLAARIAVSALHKTTRPSFSQTFSHLYAFVNPTTKRPSPLVADDIAAIVAKQAAVLDAAIDHDRDFNFDIFGFKTLEKSYLLRDDKGIVERPQHMYMRVAIGIHKDDIESALRSYEFMSRGYFTHATPTLFNAGTQTPQLSSCFLTHMKDDSINGIFDTLKDCALISKSAGGIGLSVHNVRSQGSYISGSGGRSNGLVPMLRCFDATARYVDQGGGKRKGAIAIYLEPHHSDIFEVLDLRKPGGKEEMRSRDLFFGLWTSDLFMKRVKDNDTWSLFCPNEAPGLSDVHGDEYTQLYERYEAEGRARRTVKAQELWMAIVNSQIESGTPYVLFKDACNAKSNQQNLGTIKSSNLCTEIVEFTSPGETAVCNLASIALPKFVDVDACSVDHVLLREVAYFVCISLNRVIDANFYPTPEAERSNLRHRPIGIGVQGLADVFFMLDIPFASDEAKRINEEIFETIYFGAMQASVDLAEQFGAYDSFAGSPLSQGKFQFDLWEGDPGLSGRWGWTSLRERVVRVGARNSLLLAPMPTASTASILGNVECFEPQTSNMYVRRVLSGEFVIINKHLVDKLIDNGKWNDEAVNTILRDGGSVANLDIADEIKDVYKTVWEISMKDVIDMAADRGRFICQSQSLNLFLATPSAAKISSMLFYGWSRGLKTGLYYLRSKPAATATQFTVEKKNAAGGDATSCSREGEEGCVSCGA